MHTFDFVVKMTKSSDIPVTIFILKMYFDQKLWRTCASNNVILTWSAHYLKFFIRREHSNSYNGDSYLMCHLTKIIRSSVEWLVRFVEVEFNFFQFRVVFLSASTWNRQWNEQQLQHFRFLPIYLLKRKNIYRMDLQHLKSLCPNVVWQLLTFAAKAALSANQFHFKQEFSNLIRGRVIVNKW